MTEQQQIAAFLESQIDLPRAVPRYPYWTRMQPSFPTQQGPTPDELARELLASAEFRALQLGTWLGTRDGAVIAQAVEMVTPPFYRQHVKLLIEALRIAAELQKQEGRRVAGKIALGVVVIAVILALGMASSGSRGAAT